MFKIEKGIPITHKKSESKYPFHELEVGDSILVPLELAKKTRHAAHAIGDRFGYRFATRTQPNGDLRIWRIS